MGRKIWAKGNAAMTMRNVESRLSKLEARGQRADQFLAVWREPGADIAGALADAKFATGGRVVCFEWFGDGPPPAPKWHRNSRPDFSREEESYITYALRKLVDESPLSPKDRAWVDRQAQELTGMNDGELLHESFGVAL